MRPRKQETVQTSKRPPARTIEARQNQLIAKAVDLAERRLDDGTASSQLVAHYLKLATTREEVEMEKLRIERDILREQKELVVAKTEAIKSNKRIEELYNTALSAMRSYSGRGFDDDDEDL